MENRTSTKLQAKEILDIREKLDAEIMKSWKELREDAISPKNFVQRYNHIQHLQNKRIVIKGLLMYLNENRKTFDYESFKVSNNYSIFAACEDKEAVAQLKMFSSVACTGMERENRDTQTNEMIVSLIKSRQNEAENYDAAMEKFNNETYIEVYNLYENLGADFEPERYKIEVIQSEI